MAAKTRFRGSFTALVTPFKNGAVDEKAFRDLVDWQIAEGTNGLVPVGTTGESPTLSHQEHKEVVEWCVDHSRGRVPVVAGAGVGVSEIVASETTGLLVSPGDAAAFAAAVRDLIIDRDRRAAFAEAAHRKVQTEHDLSSAARHLGAAIEMLGRSRAV